MTRLRSDCFGMIDGQSVSVMMAETGPRCSPAPKGVMPLSHGDPPVIRRLQTVIRWGELGERFFTAALLTFRVSAVAAASQPEACSSWPPHSGHSPTRLPIFVSDSTADLYHLTFRFRQPFQPAVDQEQAFGDGLFRRGQQTFVEPDGVRCGDFVQAAGDLVGRQIRREAFSRRAGRRRR